MYLLNTPLGLSAVDNFILNNISEVAKCGIIVNAGDGRLSRAIKKRLGDRVVVYNIEKRSGLYECLEGPEEQKSMDPWDLDWYQKIATKHGGLDFICFVNLHEDWNGNLYTMQQILGYLKPEGLGFISFYNKNSMYEMRQSIPPFVTGFDQLANPLSRWANIDIISLMIYLLDIGIVIDEIWGLLEEEGFKYCEENKKKKVIWQEKNLTVKINDVGDAFIFGASVMCVRFSMAKQGSTFSPKFFAIKYTASILQSILFPYIGIAPTEADIFRAHLEVENREEDNEELVLLNFFVSQLDDFQTAKTVLVVGCNWGGNLLGLQKIRPNWKITGIDASGEIISIGEEAMKSADIAITHYTNEGKFPFADNAFDLVLSLKYFSTIYYPLANALAKEMLRVSRGGIVHFEDLRGPEFSMQLKLYSIPDIYRTMGYKPEVLSVRISEKVTGLYIVKVKKE